MADLVDLFQKIGLSKEKAEQTTKNKKLSPTLELVIREAGVSDATDKTTGALLYTLASTSTPKTAAHLGYIARAIGSGRLGSNDQVSAAIKFADSVTGTIDDAVFDNSCGVGVVVTAEEIEASVRKLLKSRAAELEEKRYTALGALLGALRTDLRWANSLAVKEELDKQILALLGPKDERDNPKAKKQEKEAKPVVAKEEDAATGSAKIEELARSTKFIFEGELSRLHKPGENPQINPELMKEHLKRTGGKVVTRFPPEPNGFLHIGHAKAININFGYAAAYGGITNLRYDDTNPEAEEEQYFTSILDTVKWLGYEPSAITYSSDHFQRLYDLAVDLIRRDKAYVCHCTGEQIHADRGGEAKGPRRACVHRNRPIEESLTEFVKMKEGRYKEGEAILRMKMDLDNPNPQFWDLVAYRVLFTPHHRTADQWCIYPTYDYTHCLCDSFEDITHSMCTVEFQLSRESYYWLVDALELYKPVQWEYGRLSIANTVLSKRKLNKLVTDGHVSGWDDPRLYTLSGIRRRGFTPEAINAFVRDIGVTTSNTVMRVERLEKYIRDHLNDVAPRLMMLLEPIKVTLTNLDESYLEEFVVANKPRDDSMGTHKVPFTRTLYIDSSDFREQDEPNFYRLALGKTVGLLNVPHPITATSIVRDPATGNITEILAKYENLPDSPTRAKTYIQWVGDSPRHRSPVRVEARLYGNLFIHENPSDNPGGWLADLNPESLVVVKGAMAEVGIRERAVEDKFQAVRVGYFCVDRDSDV
ncbi:tRNA synthetases class I, catalytic domain-containing protein, partial [Blyttiomyces helicus]